MQTPVTVIDPPRTGPSALSAGPGKDVIVFVGAGNFFRGSVKRSSKSADDFTPGTPHASELPASTHPSPSRRSLHAPYLTTLAQLPFSLLLSVLFKMSSVWNALTGQKSSNQKDSQHGNAPPQHPEPTASYQPQAFDPSSAQGVDSFLNSSSFADPSQLHPLAGLNKDALEYITLEDSALSDLPGGQSVLPSRGFTDDLCYGTGITYLSALAIGGAWGVQEGLRRSAGQAPKLRLNSTLNAVTRRGPFLGNSAGVVAIVYNCVNSYFGYVRGKHDSANSIAAGALSGMLFKSTRGLRPMMISGGIVGGVAGVWTVSSHPGDGLVRGRWLRLTPFADHAKDFVPYTC